MGSSGSVMNRRETLELLVTGAALHLAPRNLLAQLRAALLATQPTPRTLDSDQSATVTAIAELIIPRTETAGASDVGVSQFIDLILTEWYTDEERDRFLNGIRDADVRTQALFGKRFVDCSSAQQSEILTALGDHMKEGNDAVLLTRRRYRGSPSKPDQDFYYMMRSLTLTAYYTSEEGATKELGFRTIPDRYEGCATARDRTEVPEER